MLDDHTLDYLEVARSALGLASRCERISTGKVHPTDKDSFERVKAGFHSLGTASASAPQSPLFATPEGLNVTIYELKKVVPGGTRMEPLLSKVDQLVQIISRKEQITPEVAASVKELAVLFRNIQAHAEEIAANGPESAPLAAIENALASS